MSAASDRLDNLAARFDELNGARQSEPDWPPFPPVEAYEDDAAVDAGHEERPCNVAGGAGDKAAPAARADAQPLRIRTLSEVLADDTPTRWLLKPYLEANAIGLLFGDLGTFKSFLALHWCLTLAHADVPVLYLSAEGRGLRKRARGWLLHRYFDRDPDEIAAAMPFYAVEYPLDLSDAGVMDALDGAIESLPRRPSLVVIDTLARYSGPLDTDKSVDAGLMIQRCDALRIRYAATVLLVGHTGHMAKDRARGSYNLMASTDAHFLVERPDVAARNITIKTGRLKDTEPPPPFGMRAEVVPTGTVDADGNPESTLVLVNSEVLHAGPRRPTGKQQALLLSALEKLHAAGKVSWTVPEIRQVGRDAGLHRNTARDAEVGLTTGGWLKHAVGGRTLAYPPGENV